MTRVEATERLMKLAEQDNADPEGYEEWLQNLPESLFWEYYDQTKLSER